MIHFKASEDASATVQLSPYDLPSKSFDLNLTASDYGKDWQVVTTSNMEPIGQVSRGDIALGTFLSPKIPGFTVMNL